MTESTGAIRRFSSRRQPLGRSFLAERLRGARTYDRIAGYFCSSILETAGEELESVQGTIRLVCNSGLQPQDVATARAAAAALRQEWCGSKPENLIDAGGPLAKARFARLFDFLRRGKLMVRVLPDRHFGLIHGKAGVITLADGNKTAFLGSANESAAAWALNYELLWEDPSPEAVAWVQEEFDALWSHHAAVPLAEAIISDVERLTRREVLPSVRDWAVTPDQPANADPAAVFVEAPVYRQQAGLWEHQKYFVKLAFDAHGKNPGGARFVLADQVGLGKTVQLAMAAELMALVSEKPILVLVPKTLLWQWQNELLELLGMPSAVWNGKQWIDESGIEHPAIGPEGIRRCPRRVGIVATSRAIFGCEDADILTTLTFECIIVDEAHNARRKNLGPGRDAEAPDANNLLRFLYEMSRQTKSMLLATATPVQLRPVEAWDLLDVLGRGSDALLGSMWSKWRHADTALRVVMGELPLPEDPFEVWQWVRDPLPPASEHRDFEILRRSLQLAEEQSVASGSGWDRLGQPDRMRVQNMTGRFAKEHNPFIRYIVRRSRKFLEETKNPETGEPYLQPIHVELYGESNTDAVQLPLYLRDAYVLAEEFCRSLGQRLKGSGFLKTLLLRRVGSTIQAGRLTAQKMLDSWQNIDAPLFDAESEGDEEFAAEIAAGTSRSLTPAERQLLERFVLSLEANQERDPKYAVVLDCLRRQRWLDRGCIIFSQYHDSVRWLAEQLVSDLPGEPLAIYAGAGKSGIFEHGRFRRAQRDEIKVQVKRGELRLLLGTDAASEGLNLQRLGSLINLDLPWNPTRLEQRKGRIQRIGQMHDTVFVYNMRYVGSVEDRVHDLLSERLEDVYTLFGQVPDVLEDVWIEVAIGENERAKQLIDEVPRQHPFDIRYERIEKIDWESCARVLDDAAKREALSQGW